MCKDFGCIGCLAYCKSPEITDFYFGGQRVPYLIIVVIKKLVKEKVGLTTRVGAGCLNHAHDLGCGQEHNTHMNQHFPRENVYPKRLIITN